MRSPSTRRRTAPGVAALTLALAIVATPFGGSVSAADEGSLDTTFDADGIVRIDVGSGTTDALHAVAIDSAGRIVAAGTSGTNGVVIRLLADGSLDTTFNTTGITSITNFDARDVAITSDGRIVAVGTSNGDVRVVRLQSNGALDGTFDPMIGSPGSVTTSLSGGTDEALAVALLSDDRILVAGRASNDLALVRYRTNGTLDTSFGGGLGIVVTGPNSIYAGETTAVARTIAVDDDGSIVVGGDTDGNLAILLRYSADGQTRSTATVFGGNGTPTAHRDLSILADGRILTAGASTPASAPVVASGLITRYTTGLLLDTTFGGNDGFNVFGASGTAQSFNAMAVQQDGRIVVAGATGSTLLIDRLDALGSSDPTFGIGWLGSFVGGDSDRADDVALQADGDIVIVGTQGDDLLIARVLGTPIVAERTETEAAPSYDLSILDAPAVGTARLTRRDGTFVLPGSSSAAGRVTYTHEEMTATFLGTAATSAQGGLVGDGRGEVVVELSGALTPDGIIEVWTASTPRLTAAHRITSGGADGEVQRFAVPLVAPLDAGGPISSGAHVLQLVLPTAIGRQVLDVTLDVRDGTTGPVPTAIPAGSGPTGPVSPSGAGLLALALAGLAALGAGRGSLRRPRAVRAAAR